jgi:transcriptional regulator
LVTRQMKRITRIRKELYHKNQDLEQLNEHLCEVVTQLNESNEVKEAYISEFFNLCSVYITKLEKYQKMLAKKAKDRNWEELNKVLRSTEMIEQELKEFYKLFDDIFFHLFPNFITEFNALLAEEERFDPKSHKMPPELRIFALIRLGITDSSKIATFLHYSTNTIYNYRTRVRNKAIVPRESFEEMVMKIDKR